MLKEFLFVGLGSALGGIFRYFISTLIKWDGHGFPLATFLVNVTGCLLIGLLAGFLARSSSNTLTLLFSVGVCGGFTTFSTFAKEAITLYHANNYGLCCTYVAGSVIIGLLAAALGLYFSSMPLQKL